MEDDKYVTQKECSLIDERVKEQMKGMEARAKIKFDNMEDRLLEVETISKDIHALALSVSDLAHSVSAMLEKQKDTDSRVSVLEGRDGEKWRSTVKYVLFTILGVAITIGITFIFSKIGIKA